MHAFMAHHQGMTIVALANALPEGVMRKRFHAEPMIQAAELLLQERTPRDVMTCASARRGDARPRREVATSRPPAVRRVHIVRTARRPRRICCRTAATR